MEVCRTLLEGIVIQPVSWSRIFPKLLLTWPSCLDLMTTPLPEGTHTVYREDRFPSSTSGITVGQSNYGRTFLRIRPMVIYGSFNTFSMQSQTSPHSPALYRRVRSLLWRQEAHESLGGVCTGGFVQNAGRRLQPSFSLRSPLSSVK